MYLQPADGEIIPNYAKEVAAVYRVQPGDELFIKLAPLDADLNDYFKSEVSGAYFSTETSVSLSSFLVDEKGFISYPLIGMIHVGGKTTSEIKDIIEASFKNIVIEGGSVFVKLVNNYVSVLGDVKMPGRFVIYKERLSVFHAIAMAGDLLPFASRSSVKIVRQTPDGPVVKTFDLRSDEILGSEFYYIQPNDVIYVGKMKGQFFRFESLTNIMTVLSGSLSIFLIALTINKN